MKEVEYSRHIYEFLGWILHGKCNGILKCMCIKSYKWRKFRLEPEKNYIFLLIWFCINLIYIYKKTWSFDVLNFNIILLVLGNPSLEWLRSILSAVMSHFLIVFCKFILITIIILKPTAFLLQALNVRQILGENEAKNPYPASCSNFLLKTENIWCT